MFGALRNCVGAHILFGSMFIGLGLLMAIRARQLCKYRLRWELKNPENAEPSDSMISWMRCNGIGSIAIGAIIILCFV